MRVGGGIATGVTAGAAACALAIGCGWRPTPRPAIAKTWTIPLVDPLANGRLVTPVTIDGHGPFLFAIDPYGATSIYRTLADQVAIGGRGSQTVRNVKIGELEITSLAVVGDDNPQPQFGTRPIFGVLGGNAIGDDRVFAFDRDRGQATVATPLAFRVPDDTYVIEAGDASTGRVTATIEGNTRNTAIDLGYVMSVVRWDDFRDRDLVNHPATVTMHATPVDRTGARRGRGSDAATLTSADVEATSGDDNMLGLGAFRAFAVAIDRARDHVYVTPRQLRPADVAIRAARWGDAIPAGCAATSCMTFAVVGNATAVTAHVTRDPRAPKLALEATFRAFDADGAELPNLYVSLPADTDTVNAPLRDAYLRATLQPVDVSPFPAPCAGGCVVEDAGEDSW